MYALPEYGALFGLAQLLLMTNSLAATGGGSADGRPLWSLMRGGRSLPVCESAILNSAAIHQSSRLSTS
jgi:hypothetical protein